MGLETFGPDSRPDVLNTDWPLLNDPLNKGDDHLRLVKTAVKNFYQDVWDSNTSKVKPGTIPVAPQSGSANSGFGGFRYTITTDGNGLKTLNLFTT